jgi:hypothetical protein
VRKEVEQALEWLTPAFSWAATGWAVEQSWPEAKPAFLAAVGLESADPDQPGHRLIVRFVEYVDSQLPDTERRRFLTDPSARTDVVDMFAGGDDVSGAGGDYASAGSEATLL